MLAPVGGDQAVSGRRDVSIPDPASFSRFSGVLGPGPLHQISQGSVLVGEEDVLGGFGWDIVVATGGAVMLLGRTFTGFAPACTVTFSA